nr:mannan endo-1,4-beta-mannosidase 7 [Tanacetum cinerariifolium]
MGLGIDFLRVVRFAAILCNSAFGMSNKLGCDDYAQVSNESTGDLRIGLAMSLGLQLQKLENAIVSSVVKVVRKLLDVGKCIHLKCNLGCDGYKQGRLKLQASVSWLVLLLSGVNKLTTSGKKYIDVARMYFTLSYPAPQKTLIIDKMWYTKERCGIEDNALTTQNHNIVLVTEAAGSRNNGGFITTRGVHFMLNGSPYYANGFNAYWLMLLASDPSQRHKVSSAFQEASSHGLSVARTWAFSDGGVTPLQYSPGSYNEQMFKGLDFVVAEARRYGIKLILSMVNNYENLGGRKQYVNWARNQGQYLTSDDDFYTNPVAKGFYKNHVKTVLTRYNTLTGVMYKNDPTIMAWELMNEPRCTSDTSGRTIQ